MMHFRNDKQTFATDKLRPQSSFNPKNKDTIIEIYLSCLEERLLDIEIPSKRYNDLTKEECGASVKLKQIVTFVV